jgi:hypothetical protein
VIPGGRSDGELDATERPQTGTNGKRQRGPDGNLLN